MTRGSTDTEPPKRRGPGCLGVIGIVIGSVVLLVIGLFVWASVSRLSDEQKVERCPGVTQDLIAAQIGDPSSFVTTETYPGNQAKGTATVRGVEYEWVCGIGITRGNTVQVDVRDSDGSSVIIEYVDL